MSTSSSDSWILIALTILVVLLLFYLSKKMICNSYGSSEADEEGSHSPTSSSSTAFSDYFAGYYQEGAAATAIGVGPFDPLNPQLSNSGSTTETDIDHGGVASNLDFTTSTESPTEMEGLGDRRNNNNNNNNRAGRGILEFSGLPLPLRRENELPENTPISIICNADLERRAMLERQLRNQIGKIVRAEQEIQRLIHLLGVSGIEHGIRSPTYLNNVMMARATLQMRSNQIHRHSHNNNANFHEATPLAVHVDATAPTFTTTTTTETQTETVLDATSTQPHHNHENNNNHNNNQNNTLAPALADKDHDNNNLHRTSSTSGESNHNHHHLQQHPHPHSHPRPPPPEPRHNSPSESSSCVLNPEYLSCGLDTFTAFTPATARRQCNPCYCYYCAAAATSQTRRMLMLRRLLMLPSLSALTFTGERNCIAEAATREYERERGSIDSHSHSHLHYHGRERDRDSGAAAAFISRMSPGESDEYNDNPPAYEECVNRATNLQNCNERFVENRVNHISSINSNSHSHIPIKSRVVGTVNI